MPSRHGVAGPLAFHRARQDRRSCVAGAPMPKSATPGMSTSHADRETWLCAIWADVCGRRRAGIPDSFFALGGHSLLADPADREDQREVRRPVAGVEPVQRFHPGRDGAIAGIAPNQPATDRAACGARSRRSCSSCTPPMAKCWPTSTWSVPWRDPLAVYGIRSTRRRAYELLEPDLDRRSARPYADEIQSVQPEGAINPGGMVARWPAGHARGGHPGETRPHGARRHPARYLALGREPPGRTGRDGRAGRLLVRTFVEFVLEFSDDDPILRRQPALARSFKSLKVAAAEDGCSCVDRIPAKRFRRS